MSTLGPEAWKSISPYLDQALDLTEAERGPWLQSLHETDPAIAAHLQELLEEHRVLAQNHFLENSPIPIPQPPSVGPYKLLSEIGQGGMGTVWLAERSDGEFQQKVAIKFLRPGADRPSLRNRFLKERQFLANLNHPAIARLLDAGQTPDARPYLIMEYVDGVPIDVHTASLDLPAILTLFLRVCDGVSHAHHRLIVHRDLKPSNILVDRTGQPKLLDFGIAKLLDDTADATQTIERVLTPNYASPEQLRGEPQTVATDVYSLGAVLHKLLHGHSPHQSASASEIPKDIQHILAKSLRPEPDERYVSVDALAHDIQCFLQHRPVQARAGDTWYRTRKFLRRHWIPVAAAAVTVIGLTTGIWIANRERTVAQRRFSQVRQLANRVFALDIELRSVPNTIKARREIVAMSQQYLEALRPEASSDHQLALEIATAYARLAQAQGLPFTANLGQFDQAEESLRRADEIIHTIPATAASYRRSVLGSAHIAQDRMILADSQRRPDDALAHARRAAAQSEAYIALGNLSLEDWQSIREMYGNVALFHKNRHRYEEAIRYAILSAGETPGAEPESFTVSNAWSIVADARRALGDLSGSLEAIQRAQAAVRKDDPNRPLAWFHQFNVLWREGLVRGASIGPSLGQADRAIDAFQQAFDLIEKQAAKDPNEAASRIRFASAGRELGGVLRHRDPLRSLAVYDHSIKRLGEVRKNAKARRSEAELLAASSYPLRDLKRFDEAKHRIDMAFAILRETKDYPASSMELDQEGAAALLALADFHAAARQHALAIRTYRELLNNVMAAKPDPQADIRHAVRLSSIYASLAASLRLNQQQEHANQFLARRLQIWQHWDRKLPHNTFIKEQLRAAL